MNEQQHLDSLHDIKRIMERSTRFMSLSGLGGIGAGISALIGAYFAWVLLRGEVLPSRGEGYSSYGRTPEDGMLIIQLLLIAGAVLVAALGTGFYFTWRKAQAQGLPVWD